MAERLLPGLDRRLRAEVGGGVLVATHEEMLVAAANRVVSLDDD